MKNKRTKSNIRLLIFNEENRTVSAENGVNIEAEMIESENGMYHIDDAVRYVDEWNGHIYYLYHAQVPEKIEAENLKKLRRSAALNRIFEYDRNKPLDIFKLLPYLIIIVLVIFGGR